MNRSGARVKCHVLAVGPRRCLVECGGYDIDLTQREMRYTAIPDLRGAVPPGRCPGLHREELRPGGRETGYLRQGDHPQSL